MRNSQTMFRDFNVSWRNECVRPVHWFPCPDPLAGRDWHVCGREGKKTGRWREKGKRGTGQKHPKINLRLRLSIWAPMAASVQLILCRKMLVHRVPVSTTFCCPLPLTFSGLPARSPVESSGDSCMSISCDWQRHSANCGVPSYTKDDCRAVDFHRMINRESGNAFTSVERKAAARYALSWLGQWKGSMRAGKMIGPVGTRD